MAASYETDPAGVMGAPVEIAYFLLTSAGLCSRCHFPRQVISSRPQAGSIPVPPPDNSRGSSLPGGSGTLRCPPPGGAP
jgi:hypothetical protein